MNIEEYQGKKILITGATGLIGKALIKELLKWNKFVDKKIRVIALVRDVKKASMVFEEFLCKELEFLCADVCDLKPQNLNISYIIHGASKTASKTFINEPVETIMTALNGTKNLLEFAKVNPVVGFVYLSSMEIYGTPTTDAKVDEQHSASLNTMTIRSCYPESKRMCENLCASYASEYGVPAKVVRLTQTFGPGVQYNDNRVFAEFARCAIESRDIILNTKGETKRNYLYTEDAVSAILTVLTCGITGEAYNAANEETYCSIYEMACLVAEKCAEGRIRVDIIEDNDVTKFGYAPTLHMNLDTSKLRGLGWKPIIGLADMFKNMIYDMKYNITM